jgi:hypothetical protein
VSPRYPGEKSADRRKRSKKKRNAVIHSRKKKISNLRKLPY